MMNQSMLNLSVAERNIVKQQIKSRNVVMPFCNKSPLCKIKVATVISIMINKHAALFKKPIIRHTPPKNSVDLHRYALNIGNGIFILFNESAKSIMLF